VGGGGVLVVLEEVDSKQKQEDSFQEDAVNEMG
jgi:hypothetical protein